MYAQWLSRKTLNINAGEFLLSFDATICEAYAIGLGLLIANSVFLQLHSSQSSCCRTTFRSLFNGHRYHQRGRKVSAHYRILFPAELRERNTCDPCCFSGYLFHFCRNYTPCIAYLNRTAHFKFHNLCDSMLLSAPGLRFPHPPSRRI